MQTPVDPQSRCGEPRSTVRTGRDQSLFPQTPVRHITSAAIKLRLPPRQSRGGPLTLAHDDDWRFLCFHRESMHVALVDLRGPHKLHAHTYGTRGTRIVTRPDDGSA